MNYCFGFYAFSASTLAAREARLTASRRWLWASQYSVYICVSPSRAVQSRRVIAASCCSQRARTKTRTRDRGTAQETTGELIIKCNGKFYVKLAARGKTNVGLYSDIWSLIDS